MTGNGRQTQSGLSLVELMIGVALGLFLLAGVIQLFAGSRHSFRANENLARVQESGRVAMDYIGAELRKAGYRSDIAIDMEKGFPEIGAFQQGAVITGNATRVSIRYYGSDDGNVRDCLGDLRAAPDLVTVTIEVNNGSLRCTRSIGGVNTTQPVLDGIVGALQLSYGIDTDADNAIDIPYVVAPANWRNVLAVRVTQLTLQSGDVSRRFGTTIGLRNPLR